MGLAIRTGQSVCYSLVALAQLIVVADWSSYVHVRFLSNGCELFRSYSDRDSGRWNVDITETHRRRELFWEMFAYDSLQVSLKL
jgi:hypothetical protein